MCDSVAGSRETVTQSKSQSGSWQPGNCSQVHAACVLPSSSLMWLTLLCEVLDLLPVVHLVLQHLPSGAARCALRATCRQLRGCAAILDTFVWFTAASPMTLQPCDLPFLGSLSRLSQLCVTHAQDCHEQVNLLGHQCLLRSLQPLLALPGLTSIELTSYHNSTDIALLSCARSLRELRAPCCAIRGEFETSPSLTKLELNNISTTAGLRQLVGLKDLDVSSSQTNSHLSAFQQLTRLRVGPSITFSLGDCDLHGLTALRVLSMTLHVLHLSQLRQLTALDLGTMLTPSVDLKCLPSLLHLGVETGSERCSFSAPSVTSIFLVASGHGKACAWPGLVQCIQLKHVLVRLSLRLTLHVAVDQLPSSPIILSMQDKLGWGIIIGTGQRGLVVIVVKHKLGLRQPQLLHAPHRAKLRLVARGGAAR